MSWWHFMITLACLRVAMTVYLVLTIKCFKRLREKYTMVAWKRKLMDMGTNFGIQFHVKKLQMIVDCLTVQLTSITWYTDLSQHQSHQGLYGNRKNSDLIEPWKSLRESVRRPKSGMRYPLQMLYILLLTFSMPLFVGAKRNMPYL